METFYITKKVHANSIASALEKESEGEVVAIEKEREEEGHYNTHAIGFNMQTEELEYEE